MSWLTECISQDPKAYPVCLLLSTMSALCSERSIKCGLMASAPIVQGGVLECTELFTSQHRYMHRGCLGEVIPFSAEASNEWTRVAQVMCKSCPAEVRACWPVGRRWFPCGLGLEVEVRLLDFGPPRYLNSSSRRFGESCQDSVISET